MTLGYLNTLLIDVEYSSLGTGITVPLKSNLSDKGYISNIK